MIPSNEAYKLFQDIAKTSGTRKQWLLKGANVKEYLLAAYDPFTMYHITKSKEGQGTKEFDEVTWSILKSLSDHSISGLDAQTIVDIHTSELTKESAELFKMILNKDLRMGMGVKTINKVFPGLIPTHDIMLAKTYDPSKIKFPCYAGLKIDCVRAIYNPKTEKFYSRKGHEYYGLDHLIKEIIDSGINTRLDVELAIKGGKFQWSSGKIRDYNPTPNAVAHIIELPDINEEFAERLDYMKELSFLGEHLLEIPHIIVHNHDEMFDYFKKVRLAGYEGLILRPIDYPYENKRSYNWQKVKNIIDLDLKVIDIYEGKGKYENQLGGVIVEYLCEEPVPKGFNWSGQKVGGGFSDYKRIMYWNKPEIILGKTIHVIVTEFTDDKNFRHARMGKQKIRRDK